MVWRLSKIARVRAAVALAVTYAFCVLAPHAALALTHAAIAIHCLNEPMTVAHVHQAAMPVEHAHSDAPKHVHHDEGLSQTTQHRHADHAKNGHSPTPGQNDSNCCGLFCVTALAGRDLDVLPLLPTRSFRLAFRQAAGTPIIPSRITEPPIG
jgi:hypothetical protein